MIGSLVLFACGQNESPEPTQADGPLNVLLISVDTLRADHLGCYGYDRPTTPRIDQLGAQSIVFEDAHAPSSWTLPSLATLMTAVYPASHGCVVRDRVLDPGFETLAEKLRDNGFYTGGIVTQTFASRRFGLDRGFLSFNDDLAELSRGNELFKKTSRSVSDKATKWIAARAGEARPWFLWLHYFDPHLAYVPHPGYSEAFGSEQDIDLYDGEIAWTDFHVGRVLDALSEFGFDENTLIVFTSDHGEEFGDHGGRYHRSTLYREVLEVPLIVRIPGRAAERTDRLTSLVDVAPLILQLTGTEPIAAAHGASPLDEHGRVNSASETIYAELLLETGEQLSASIGTTKWIAKDSELVGFDRASDPNELKPLEANADARAELERLKEHAARYASLRTGARKATLSPAESKALKALGYAGDER